MPYKSHAQQKYFHYLESQGKMPKKTIHEFDESTDYADLPDHVKKRMAMGGRAELEHGEEELPHDEENMPHYAYGGEVEENPDYEQGNMSEFDSSGEPHTEDKMEDEHPMEYMYKGGMAKRRMARGGMVHNSKFARALRRGY